MSADKFHKKRSQSPNGSDPMLTPPSSLTTSASDLPVVLAGMENSNQMSLIVQTQKEFLDSSSPIENRFSGAVIAHRNYSRLQSHSMGSAVSETLLTQQQKLESNDLLYGLTPLKGWVADNVHSVLVPPTDSRLRSISNALQRQNMCVVRSRPGCGVKEYLTAVCAELRIDLFVIRGTYFDPEMFDPLIREARASRRALVLFDRTEWFTNAGYATRGCTFVHHLQTAIDRAVVTKNNNSLGGALAQMSLRNRFRRTTLSDVFPGMWIVFSCNNMDVSSELLRLANGSVCDIKQTSKDLAIVFVLDKLKSHVRNLPFDQNEISLTLSSDYYQSILQQIGELLKNTEMGEIANLIDHALGIAWRRDVTSKTAGMQLLPLLPTAADVQQSMQTLNMGPPPVQSEANSLTAMLNAQRPRVNPF